MMEVCGDGRFEIIEKAKQAIIESTNIETSPEEMAVLDSILFRCWQMGWLDKYGNQQPDGDLISRQDAINAFYEPKNGGTYAEFDDGSEWYMTSKQIYAVLESLPSAEPKTETVLCALADRECPFQGKEFAWCLTCPHISEEDRALVKKVVAEPKTGKWKIDEYGIYHCPICHAINNTVYKSFCPNCGADMRGEEE